MSGESAHLGRIAGIDFGTVRIGVALTDARQSIASPYEVYHRRGPDADARHFRSLAKEEQIVRFVVGLPVHMSGEESAKSRQAREFGAWLAQTTGVEVVYYDERYSTAGAESLLEEAQFTSKKRKQRRDMLAAQIILASYLESKARGQDEPGALDD